ncbi:MAG: hypothetical protein KY461_06105 [Actinobacteria bacterium]|nr:hypothetical protein [Actinomycetota bacterium]
MTGEQTWLAVLVVASVVVVVIALLFGVVIILLRQIDHHAARTYTAGKQIAQNTVALWTLEQTNRDLIAIRDAARAAARPDDREGGPLGAVAERVQEWLGGSDDEPRP